MTTWTVVFRKSQFAAAFTQTGDVFATWEEATEAARRWAQDLPDDAQVWYVATTETHIEVEVSNGKGGTMIRRVKIAPTKAQKAEAKARQAAIDALLERDAADKWGWSALRGFSGRLSYVGIEHGDLAATAAYCVEHGMTYSDVCRTQA